MPPTHRASGVGSGQGQWWSDGQSSHGGRTCGNRTVLLNHLSAQKPCGALSFHRHARSAEGGREQPSRSFPGSFVKGDGHLNASAASSFGGCSSDTSNLNSSATSSLGGCSSDTSNLNSSATSSLGGCSSVRHRPFPCCTFFTWRLSVRYSPVLTDFFL